MTTHIFVSGHRPPKIGGYDPLSPLRKAVRTAIRDKILSAQRIYGDITLIVGGALGVDQDAAYECRKFEVPYKLFAPCWGQETKWPEESQYAYRLMKSKAIEVRYTHEGTYPGAWCMQRRNEEMVDAANYGLVVWDGSEGGTANCVRYAESKGVPMARINPNNLLQTST